MQLDTVRFEFVIRKIDDLQVSKYRQFLSQFIEYDVNDKITVNVPIDWEGFKNGIFQSMMGDFGQSMYIALSYVSSGSEIVTDFDGSPVLKIERNLNDRTVYKYVKKRLKIISVVDYDKNVFSVKAYMLNFKIMPPVSVVLDMYSGSIDSGIMVDDMKYGCVSCDVASDVILAAADEDRSRAIKALGSVKSRLNGVGVVNLNRLVDAVVNKDSNV